MRCRIDFHFMHLIIMERNKNKPTEPYLFAYSRIRNFRKSVDLDDFVYANFSLKKISFFFFETIQILIQWECSFKL